MDKFLEYDENFSSFRKIKKFHSIELFAFGVKLEKITMFQDTILWKMMKWIYFIFPMRSSIVTFDLCGFFHLIRNGSFFLIFDRLFTWNI